MSGTPHKHRDVIIAWANGEEIEGRIEGCCDWYPIFSESPAWKEEYEFRIKPKIVKREGWVNIHRDKDVIWIGAPIYITKEEADFNKTNSRIACTRIEWEEEA